MNDNDLAWAGGVSCKDFETRMPVCSLWNLHVYERWPFHFPAYLKQTKSNSSDVLSFVNVCAGLKWVYFVHPVEPALDLLFCPLHSSTVALWTLYFFSFSSQSWWRIIFVQLINFLKNLKADCWMIRYFQLLFFLIWCFPLWPRAFVKEHSFC